MSCHCVGTLISQACPEHGNIYRMKHHLDAARVEIAEYQKCEAAQDATIDRLNDENIRMTAEIEQYQQECTDWQILVEELFEYAGPKDQHLAEFNRLAHRAVTTKGSDNDD